MKIIIEKKDNRQKEIILKNVEYIDNYLLKIEFFDGKENKIDFKEFLLSSNHPSVKKYLDINKFKKFKIQNGNINWNDYEMIFPIYDLYNGKIM